jgi:hypothetical protein
VYDKPRPQYEVPNLHNDGTRRCSIGQPFYAHLPTQAPLKFTFDTTDLGGASVTTSGAKLYAYSTADGTPVSGVTVQAGEAAVTSTWVSIGTTGAAAAGLSLGDQSTATSHNFFAAISITPTSTGAKTTNVLKLSLTYV